MEKEQMFKITHETALLAKHLEQLQVGDVATYEELNAVVFGNVRGGNKGNLAAARKILQREKNILFGTIRNTGIKRLSDAEVVSEGSRGMSVIRNAARRFSSRITCLQDFDALTVEAKAKHNASLSVFGAIAHFTKPSNVRQVEASAQAANDRLAIGQTLKIFEG